MQNTKERVTITMIKKKYSRYRWNWHFFITNDASIHWITKVATGTEDETQNQESTDKERRLCSLVLVEMHSQVYLFHKYDGDLPYPYKTERKV